MLTVIVIAKDAQNTLDKCLSSVKSLADEILVFIDERTTDQTRIIALKYNAKITTGKFTDFSDLRNRLATQAAGDWLLHIDSDEWLSSQLITEIKTVLTHPIYLAYRLPRLNFIFGKYIRHTNWDPHGLIRLYSAQRFTWTGLVHSELQVPTPVGRLTSPIYHLNYTSVEQFISKMDQYTSLDATGIVNFSLVKFFFEPIKDFFRRFIRHAGFLDGWHGLFLSYLMAIYYLELWIKVWQKQNPPLSPP